MENTINGKELECELEKARKIMVNLIEITDIYSPQSECISEAKQFVMGSEKAYKDAISNLYNWQKEWKFLKMLKDKTITKEELRKLPYMENSKSVKLGK